MKASHHWRRDCRTLANTPDISRISPATMATLATRPCRIRRGLRKHGSSYDPKGRNLGRRGQASMPANLLDHPV
ncbi:hypothetical protein TNCV_1948711 [Trichonephila clavipes]|nr:hypothetical protein TNCV_1948711 [Trichonephila clavipes]